MNHNRVIELLTHYLGQVWLMRSLDKPAELPGNYYSLRTTNVNEEKISTFRRVIII